MKRNLSDGESWGNANVKQALRIYCTCVCIVRSLHLPIFTLNKSLVAPPSNYVDKYGILHLTTK